MVWRLVACGSKQDDTQAPLTISRVPKRPASSTPPRPRASSWSTAPARRSTLAAACENFEKMYGIEVEYQRLSTGEVQAKIEEENGNPSADVWFGGTTDPYNVCAAEGLLEAYQAENASHLIKRHVQER